ISTSGVIKTELSDHYLVFCIIHPTVISLNSDHGEKRDFRAFSDVNIFKFFSLISQATWENVYACLDVDTAFSELNHSIQSYYTDAFPLKTKYVTSSSFNAKNKHWFSAYLQQLSFLKQRLYRRYKSSGLPAHKLDYLNAKRRFETNCYLTRSSYYESKFNSVSGDSRLLWREINSCIDIKKRTSGSQIHKLTVSNTSFTSNDIAPILNYHFATIGSKLNSSFQNSGISAIDKYMV